MKKLALQWFIEQHRDWETILCAKPYCLRITRDFCYNKNLVMFKYNQIDSDFSIPLVREARGLILDEDTNKIISFPFTKFFNFGEPNAASMDWKSAYTTEKIDGSLIKAVKLESGEVLLSTNGTIDAFKAPLAEQIGCKAKSFGDLVIEALAAEQQKHEAGKVVRDWVRTPLEWLSDQLIPGYTYMFELTSPFNKVVVQWHDTRLHFIGCRDNATGQETFFADHPLKAVFDTPKVFSLKSIDECVEAAKQLDCNHEGYVVVDKDFNRVKVKSPLYVAIHHLRGENGMISYRRALEIVKKNEIAEVLQYFPEYKSAFDDLEKKFNAKVQELNKVWEDFNAVKFQLPTRKDQAIWITSHCKNSGFLFALLDGKISSIHDGIYNSPNENILKILGYRDGR